MSIRGKKFKRHEGYHAIVPKPYQNPKLQTKIVRCIRCKELFVISAPANTKVSCTHCFNKMWLNNDKYYMDIENVTKEDADKLNSSRSMMNALVRKKLKGRD